MKEENQDVFEQIDDLFPQLIYRKGFVVYNTVALSDS
jgi:hypothetical protein